MIRIDMTEEPENEDDLIFKAQHIYIDGEIGYMIPVQGYSGLTTYVDREIYQYILDNVMNK